MRPVSFFSALFALILTCFASTAVAQFAGRGPAPTVNEIHIDFGELKNASREVVMAHVQLREGGPFDQLLLDRSVRSLYDTQLFDFVQAQVDDVGPNRVDITLKLQSKYRIQDINIVGNDNYSRRKLLKTAKMNPGTVLDERMIASGAEEIRDYYRKKGYTNVKVDYSIDRNPSTGLGSVTLRVDEGKRLKIGKITFDGNEAIDDGDLRGVVDTARYKWWWSWISGSGRIEEEKLNEDIDKLREFYVNKGYLDFELSADDVQVIETSGEGVILNFNLVEGRQYYVGDIKVEGVSMFQELVITLSLKMIPGDPFSPEKLNEDLQMIEDIYGAVGRLEARVRAERTPNLETGNIDIKYLVDEGEEFYIESVNIEGNTKTKSVVILRELAMQPGQLFNTVRMKASESRLKNTRFFGEVVLSPEATNIPGRRNLKVDVKETTTGQFQFGAGFSSLESATVFVEVSQGNFDLFNWRSFFQGDGQKFRFRASVGSRSSEVILSFEEPYFMEQRIGVGFELYRRTSDYNSSYYEEARTGLQLYARKRLFELVEGRLTYTIEQVDIDTSGYSASSVPYAIYAENGKRLVSKVGLMMLRDTRNDLLFTTRGSRMSLDVEYAGIGGDVNYVSIESRNAFYLPTFQTGDQVLSLLFRTGTIIPLETYTVGIPLQNTDGSVYYAAYEYGVPFFDRFFLGGPYSLRGYEYREVGPQDANPNAAEYVGGNTYGFASLEYTIKLAEQFRIAAFYDWGFVNVDEFDFRPTYYNDNWGVGIRLLVLNNPLSLDYALPLTSGENNDEGGQFNFSFGTRF